MTSAFRPGQAAEQVGHERRGLDDLLEVVQHQQQALVAEEGLRAGRPAGSAPMSRRPRAWAIVVADQAGVGDRGEADEGDAIGEVAGRRARRRDRDAGLADPAGTGQRQ